MFLCIYWISINENIMIEHSDFIYLTFLYVLLLLFLCGWAPPPLSSTCVFPNMQTVHLCQTVTLSKKSKCYENTFVIFQTEIKLSIILFSKYYHFLPKNTIFFLPRLWFYSQNIMTINYNFLSKKIQFISQNIKFILKKYLKISQMITTFFFKNHYFLLKMLRLFLKILQ